MKKTQISVIVPIYNVEKFLDKCISSIVTQTYKNLDILLIDDGSTDNSGNKCDEWAKKDSRIRVIHKENGGLSDARNAGIDVATGSFIAFIDSDDFIYPGYFDYLYNLISCSNADMAVCQVVGVDENDKKIGIGGVAVNRTINGNVECMRAFLDSNAIDTTAWRKLYRTSLFKESGIRYPKGRYHEDVYTTYRIVALCECIVIGAKPLYAYRQRTGSIVKSSFSPKHMDAIWGNLERQRFIEKHYPHLKELSTKRLLYANNTILYRLISDPNINTSRYIGIIKKVYRKYWKNYMRSNASVSRKLFVTLMTVNAKLGSKILQFIIK